MKKSLDRRNSTAYGTSTQKRDRAYSWAFGALGLLSLIWFSIRCLPKPSRMSYPCQRAAAPLAAGFLLWLCSIGASALALIRARNLWRGSRYLLSCALLFLGAALALYGAAGPAGANRATAGVKAPHAPNQPIGTARGIFPGRVVWVRDQSALDWDGTSSGVSEGYWNGHTDQAVIDQMMSRSLQLVTGEQDDASSWEAIFRYFNNTHGRGDSGYQAGEKVAVKINLTTTNGDIGSLIDASGDQINHKQYTAPSLELTHALLDQLVNTAGVAQSDVSIGDTTGNFPNHIYNYLVNPAEKGGGGGEFTDVTYISRNAFAGRVADARSAVQLHFSTAAADSYKRDYVPQSYANAVYFINLAILKTHARAGVTLCAKNLYGSLIRRPNDSGFYPLHDDLPNQVTASGSYRPLVDLLGHQHLGGKTLLGIIDGLWSGYDWSGVSPPLKWQSPPFDDTYPSSILMSQDPVALDSVGYDLWWSEAESTSLPGPDPRMPGGDDYLHEAAQADDPPSGTFYDPEGDGTGLNSLGVHEHWNNGFQRKYSRNLGTGDGIELIEADSAVNYCGDGIVQGAEACDDGNTDPDDGCDASCQSEEVGGTGGGGKAGIDRNGGSDGGGGDGGVEDPGDDGGAVGNDDAGTAGETHAGGESDSGSDRDSASAGETHEASVTDSGSSADNGCNCSMTGRPRPITAPGFMLIAILFLLMRRRG